MRIALIAIGSRGDVQPYVALGRGLKESGHDICVVTHAVFENFVRDAQLDFGLIRQNPQQTLQSDFGQAALNNKGAQSLQSFSKLINQNLPQIFVDTFAACETQDALIASPLAYYCAPHIADKLGILLINAYTLPVHSTRKFPNYLFATAQKRGALYNQLTYLPGALFGWIPFIQMINQCRQSILGLPRVSPQALIENNNRWPMLYGFSPTILPKPDDWGDNIDVTGYWFLNQTEGWQPPAALIDFISAGSKPIYIGFGSMNSQNAQATTDLIIQALKATHQRAVLATGWGGLEPLQQTDQLIAVNDVPHDWLFPQMAAVVHHGGAGTTAAGLRAGIPSVIVPFYMDQPFWGYRVAQLHAGPTPIPHNALTVEKLSNAIQAALNNPLIQKDAAVIGRAIRSENGVSVAVEKINSYLRG